MTIASSSVVVDLVVVKKHAHKKDLHDRPISRGLEKIIRHFYIVPWLLG